MLNSTNGLPVRIYAARRRAATRVMAALLPWSAFLILTVPAPLLSDHLLRHLTTFMIDFLIFINFLKLCVAFFFELEDLLLHVLFHRLDVYSPAF